MVVVVATMQERSSAYGIDMPYVLMSLSCVRIHALEQRKQHGPGVVDLAFCYWTFGLGKGVGL